MDEKRKSQVINLLKTLNEMCREDFGSGYAFIEFKDDTLFVDARTRSARVALEVLLSPFRHLSVFVVGNTKLEILFSECLKL